MKNLKHIKKVLAAKDPIYLEGERIAQVLKKRTHLDFKEDMAIGTYQAMYDQSEFFSMWVKFNIVFSKDSESGFEYRSFLQAKIGRKFSKILSGNPSHDEHHLAQEIDGLMMDGRNGNLEF